MVKKAGVCVPLGAIPFARGEFAFLPETRCRHDSQKFVGDQKKKKKEKEEQKKKTKNNVT